MAREVIDFIKSMAVGIIGTIVYVGIVLLILHILGIHN